MPRLLKAIAAALAAHWSGHESVGDWTDADYKSLLNENYALKRQLENERAANLKLRQDVASCRTIDAVRGWELTAARKMRVS